jgi:hypothetical protein
MTSMSRVTLIVAAAAVSIASPALAQPYAQAPGAQVTGSASNREDLNSGYYAPDFGGRNEQVAVRQNGQEETAARAGGRRAYAMVPHARAFYDYSPVFPGAWSGNSYDPATSGYDPGIETQR